MKLRAGDAQSAIQAHLSLNRAIPKSHTFARPSRSSRTAHHNVRVLGVSDDVFVGTSFCQPSPWEPCCVLDQAIDDPCVFTMCHVV